MIKNIMINASKVPAAPAINRELWAWGYNDSGQLGDGTQIDKSSPIQVGALTDWSDISFGESYSLAVKKDGTLWAWGNNSYGQLGDGTITARSSPVQIGTLTNWAKVAAGAYQSFLTLTPASFAIKTDGTLWSWGSGLQGNLGDGTSTTKSSPVQIGTGTNWSYVVSGGACGFAIKTDGTMWSWGDNSYGKLGLGAGDTTARSSPTQIGTLTTWTKVVAGGFHTAAIKNDGTLWTWGRNTAGQLGDFSTVDKQSPIQVGSFLWSNVTAGYSHTIGIQTDSSMWAWGGNTAGALGLSLPNIQPARVMAPYSERFRKVFAGGNHTLAIKINGTLWGWGVNSNGQLGRGSLVASSSPVQIGTLTTWKDLGCGYQHSLMLRNDGSLWSTGVNTFGQLGDNTTTRRSSPVQVVPTTKTNWVAVDGGLNFSMALDSSGSLWTWGFNGNGELGLNISTTLNVSSPVQVGTLTNWSKISAANGGFYAIKTDGTLWSNGFGAFGALGDGTTTRKSSPVQIGTLTGWQKVAGGGYYGLAIRGAGGTGSLWAWGYNNVGQLGDGTTTNQSSPVQIGTLTNWKEVYAGQDSGAGSNATSLAIKTDGTLWGWGLNSSGQVGDGTTTNRSSPVQIGTLTTWVSASAGELHMIAMETTSSGTGSLYSWGGSSTGDPGSLLGRYGQATATAGTNSSSPIQLGTFSADDYKWSKTVLTSKGFWSVALKNGNSPLSGSLWSWGQNANGQLGQGSTTLYSSPVQIGTLTTWVSASAGWTHGGAIKQY